MAIDLFKIGPITLHGYGLMIGIGLIMALIVGEKWFVKKGLKPEAVLDIVLICGIFGFAGGKLLFIITEWKQFLAAPLSVLGSSGFVVYGGIFVSVLCIMLYCRIKKYYFMDYFDALVPEVALAQGFGRIGCFLAGCCYGHETHAWYGVVFPENSLAVPGVKLIPTQLISSVGDFAIFGILILIDIKTKNHPKRLAGDVGFCYMILYGIGRFLVEILRNDPRGAVGVLSTSQFISIFMFGLGVILMIAQRFRKETKKPEEV